DGSVAVYDRDGERGRRLSGHRSGALATAWSSSGKRLASAGQDGLVRLWDCELDRELLPMEAGDEWVEHLAWCPRADVLASAAGQVVRLWDADGQLVHEYPALSHTVAGLVWRPASRRLTAAAYGGLTMWEG